MNKRKLMMIRDTRLESSQRRWSISLLYHSLIAVRWNISNSILLYSNVMGWIGLNHIWA